jgi:hypothetical protein
MPDVGIESRMPLHDSYSYYLKDTLLEIVRIVSSLAVSSTKEITSGMVKACRQILHRRRLDDIPICCSGFQ